jgi:lipid-A-disaccharide synthase
VNGFREPFLRLPNLYQLYRRLAAAFIERRIDAFVGIDFNVFNFILEGRLKRHGIATAHYVSPSVYAWRRGRTKKVARCADKVFCLFPFEPAFYQQHDIEARFIGHPLASEISVEAGSESARDAAKAELGLNPAHLSLALLPGSRGSEVDLMLAPMLSAARLLANELRTRGQTLQVVIPCLSPARKAQVDRLAEPFADVYQLHHLGSARVPLIACDLALVKSGTSTLETMLLRRPMVVTYRLGFWTFLIANALLKTPYIAIPNILAKRRLVPELVQQAATPEAIYCALLGEFEKSREDPDYFQVFDDLHRELASGASGLGASAGAALGVVDLLREKDRLPSSA